MYAYATLVLTTFLAVGVIVKIEIHSSCEIEYFVETHHYVPGSVFFTEAESLVVVESQVGLTIAVE